MDWSEVAPMIATIGFTLIIALTVLLWPLSRRLGHLLQLVIEEKSSPRPLGQPEGDEGLRRIEARLARLEEEQRFTSALLANGRSTAQAPLAPADRRAASPPA